MTGTAPMRTGARGSVRERNASSDEHAEHAWRAMRTLLLDLHDRRGEVSQALDMSYIRAKALLQLSAGPLTMRELAGKLVSDPPYTTVVVDDLERRGLVERATHPDDRRVKVVTITAAGAESAALAKAIQNEPPAVLRGLGANDLAILDRILSRLVAGQS